MCSFHLRQTRRWTGAYTRAACVNYHIHLQCLICAQTENTTNKQKEDQDFPVALFVCAPQHLVASSYVQKIGRHNNVLVVPPSISFRRYFWLNELGYMKWKECIMKIWVTSISVKYCCSGESFSSYYSFILLHSDFRSCWAGARQLIKDLKLRPGHQLFGDWGIFNRILFVKSAIRQCWQITFCLSR